MQDQAHHGVSVPRPFVQRQVYQDTPVASSVEGPESPRISGEIGVYAGARPWLDRGRVGDALVRAARRIGRPLRRDQLVAAASLRRQVLPVEAVEEVLDELASAGRLVVEWRFLWGGGGVAYYSAPRGAGR